MDISEYEQADIIFDLNEPEVPAKLRQKFDYILDGGTTEHVFNFTQALINIASMLKVGGRVVHYLPACGYINHGYYSLSPSIFQDFYASNGFRVEKINIILSKYKWNEPVKEMADCVTTEPDFRVYNLRDADGLPGGYKGFLRCVAKKVEQRDKFSDPKQTHWYGIVNGDLLQEMWGVDTNIERNDVRIGVWGIDNIAQIFLNVMSNHPKFQREKIVGFFATDTMNVPQSFNGYAIHDEKDLPNLNLDVLFLATLDGSVYERLRGLEGHGIKVIRLTDYWAALQS